jgi:hypothetical protein
MCAATFLSIQTNTNPSTANKVIANNITISASDINTQVGFKFAPSQFCIQFVIPCKLNIPQTPEGAYFKMNN